MGGFNVVSFYANKFITKFENFKGFNWSALRILDFPSLRELDLSGMINVNVSGNFLTEVANIASNTGLVSIEKLLLRDVKFRKEDQNRDYRLDLSQCHYLNHLDVSNSDFTQFALPSSASLKYYNLSNTSIPSLNLKDQSFLETLILDGCDNLTAVTIENCNSLRNINLPPNVKTLEVLNCPLLEELNITYRSSGGLISGLTYINVERCDGLKVFNISGQNNEQLKVNLNGAPNLEHLDFSYTNTQNILLPNLKGDKAFKTLRSLDISNTKIKYLEFNDDVPGETDTNRLNLLNFNNLDTIKATYNSSVQYIDCVNSKDSVIRLNSAAFSECTRLKELNGHFSIEGQEVFKNCAALELNDVKHYESAAPSDFLIGENRTNIKINTTSLRSVFFGCSSLSFDDFKRIQAQFIPGINSLEDTFNGCRNIRGEIRRDLFTKCRDIEILKGAFKDTGISGPIVSRADNFSMEDETTWGTFDYIPKLTDAESAFS